MGILAIVDPVSVAVIQLIVTIIVTVIAGG